MPTSAAIPRKRPRQARSRATVDAILEAAARVLREEGYEGASTNRVAEVAGVSVGSLYQYFPNKTALVGALIERHVDETMELLGSELLQASSLPLEQAARRLVSAMLEVHRIDPELHRVFAEQVPRVADLEDVRSVHQAAQKMIRGYLEERRHELRELDTELAAFLIVQAVESATHGAVLQQPEMLERRALVDEITELVVRYLRP